MYKIAILVTTFLRDKLLYRTLQSIVEYAPENSILLIADQGYSSDEKKTEIDFIKSQMPCEYYSLPFDCGLSAGRNFLVNKAIEMNIPYCLLLADSIQFTQRYYFDAIIEFLERDTSTGIVGFDLDGSKCSWEYKMELTKNGIQFIESNELVEFNGAVFKKVDICRNVFLAKTDVLKKNQWDNELKLAEHEKFFLDLKQINYGVFWTNAIKFKRSSPAASEEYQQYRKRFGDYQRLLKQKLGTNGWVIYPKN